MQTTLPRHVAHSAYMSERRALPLISKFLIEVAYWFTQRTERSERRMQAEVFSDHLAKDIGLNTVRYNRRSVHQFPTHLL